MIRTEAEYQHAVSQVALERKRFAEHALAWKAQGFSDAQVAKLMEPLESVHQQLVDEIHCYERLMQGQFPEIENFSGLGQLLIGLRIARGMTQRDLAKNIGVNESQVSRDERNEYHGLTVERARRILEALGASLVTKVRRDSFSAPVAETAAPMLYPLAYFPMEDTYESNPAFWTRPSAFNVQPPSEIRPKQLPALSGPQYRKVA
jgi:transcriptional regulator with XRE-family HTH domain